MSTFLRRWFWAWAYPAVLACLPTPHALPLVAFHIWCSHILGVLVTLGTDHATQRRPAPLWFSVPGYAIVRFAVRLCPKHPWHAQPPSFSQWHAGSSGLARQLDAGLVLCLFTLIFVLASIWLRAYTSLQTVSP